MRVEAARLVRALCNGSDLTLQTLISCGGLAVLAQFLGAGPRIDGAAGSGNGGGPAAGEEAGEGPGPGAGAGDAVDDARRLVRIGIDGVLKVFSLQRIRRNDFCKLFLRLGLMPRVMVRERERARDWLTGGTEGEQKGGGRGGVLVMLCGGHGVSVVFAFLWVTPQVVERGRMDEYTNAVRKSTARSRRYE